MPGILTCRSFRAALAAGVFGLSCLLAQGSTPAAALAWPPPPADPDIVFIRQIAAPKDIGAKAPFFTRLANHLTGVAADSQSLVRPFGLSLDDAGNLLVTDTAAKSVCCVDLAHKKWQRWTAVDKRPFISPVAAVHFGKMFYVVDSGRGSLIAFDEKGRGQFETTNELARPSGIARLGTHLLVVDSALHQVVVFGLQGDFMSKFGRRGQAPGEFNFPTHIAVDAQDRIYVTDSLNYRIQVFNADGQFVREFGSAGDGPGHFTRPKGVAVDPAGHVYVVDAVFGNVQIFNNEGLLLLDFCQSGSDAGQLWLPNAIAINSRNEIFVADAYNHRLQMFRYTGKE